MKKPVYTDHLEAQIGKALTEKGIKFIHGSQGNNQRLDFYLPDLNIYLEVKQYHTERSLSQLASQDNIILIQGREAVAAFIQMIKTAI